MLPSDVVLACLALVGTAAIGVIVHELSHALVLRAVGIPCTVEVLPGRNGMDGTGWGIVGPLARVTPTGRLDVLSPWHLRVAAMMPLCLAVPFCLALAGVFPDPFATGDLALEAATIAWLGCAVPSPSDFSLFWYPERTIEAAGPTELARPVEE